MIPQLGAEDRNAKAQLELSGLRVLVVDDSADHRRLHGYLLERAGAQIEFASHGEEAVARCRAMAEAGPDGSPPIDLILMDLQMPLLDGMEATRQIRALQLPLVIIAVSAADESEFRRQAADAGCDAFLSKPVSGPTLCELILVTRHLRAAEMKLPA